MTRLCGECSKPCKKYGAPRRNGSFLDQIVTCPKCGWCGVETEIVENEEPIQLDMFAGVDFSGLPEFGARASQRGGDGEQADGDADHADALGLGA
jgi:hypothetical protein